MITPRNASPKKRLLEIASRIHCPDSEGGKYAAQIKEEIEDVANTLSVIPEGVVVEDVQSWGQRKVPLDNSLIFFDGSNWAECTTPGTKAGIYLGDNKVMVFKDSTSTDNLHIDWRGGTADLTAALNQALADGELPEALVNDAKNRLAGIDGYKLLTIRGSKIARMTWQVNVEKIDTPAGG